MTADLLTRAIAELDRLVEASTPGLWVMGESWPGIETVVGTGRPDLPPRWSVVSDSHGGNAIHPNDAELVIKLHRTIPAQRELLTLALEYGELAPGNGSRFIAVANNLARLILGEDA